MDGRAVRTRYGSPQSRRQERLPRFRCGVVSDNPGFSSTGTVPAMLSDPGTTASGYLTGTPTSHSCGSAIASAGGVANWEISFPGKADRPWTKRWAARDTVIMVKSVEGIYRNGKVE